MVRNKIALFFSIISLCLAVGLLLSKYLSGVEFIAFITVCLLVSLVLFFSDSVKEISFAGNVIKLEKQNKIAEENISKLEKLTRATVKLHILQYPGIYEDHSFAALGKAKQFLESYKLILAIDSSEENTKPLYPKDIIERVTRDFLVQAGLDADSQIYYGVKLKEIPKPEELLKKWGDKIKNSPIFIFYRDELYSVYINSLE